jgi:hypothetical protein
VVGAIHLRTAIDEKKRGFGHLARSRTPAAGTYLSDYIIDSYGLTVVSVSAGHRSTHACRAHPLRRQSLKFRLQSIFAKETREGGDRAGFDRACVRVRPADRSVSPSVETTDKPVMEPTKLGSAQSALAGIGILTISQSLSWGIYSPYHSISYYINWHAVYIAVIGAGLLCAVGINVSLQKRIEALESAARLMNRQKPPLRQETVASLPASSRL